MISAQPTMAEGAPALSALRASSATSAVTLGLSAGGARDTIANMVTDDFEIIRGSGNVFRDLGHPNADREQLRALLAARFIGVLDDRKLTVRAAQDMTGIAAGDFSRIRGAKLDRFTIDRLMLVLAGLGQQQ